MEFKEAMFDKRSKNKVIKLADAMSKSPKASVQKLCDSDWKKTKSAYRMIDSENSRINFDTILEPHKNNTVRRIRKDNLILWVSDGSDLSSKGKKCELGDKQVLKI